MLTASIIASACLAGLAVLHAIAGKFFSVVIVNGKRPINPAFQPKTAVILSVRGCDPSLERCLRGLLNQSHSNYLVSVVVDHISDEAWLRVQHIKREFDTFDRMTVLELENPLNSCSLKCSALVQAIEVLPDDVELIVLTDADVVPHNEWLMQATSPLCDPRVGVVTGNQWFEPTGDSAGSLLRTLWNAGALVPTAVLANPWAGSCAMRLSDIRAAGLVETWKRSIVDDGPIRDAFRPLGKHIVFNPELIMVNRENCTTGYVNQYVPRMLTWSRLYERTFVNTFLYMLTLVFWFLATTVTGVASLIAGNWLAAGICGLAMLVNSGLNVLAYVVTRRSIQRIEGRRDEAGHEHHLGKLGFGRMLRLSLLIPLCQLGFGYWMLRSVFVRQLQWRQITYEVQSRTEIRMLSYRPMQPAIDSRVTEVSI